VASLSRERLDKKNELQPQNDLNASKYTPKNGQKGWFLALLNKNSRKEIFTEYIKIISVSHF
jgi:hypothetical protein